MKYYTIKTVGDLINELSKHDKGLPIMKSEIIPMDIARLKIQDVNEYGYNGKIKSTYKALVIR